MNLGEIFRTWKDEWPEASRWAVPIWLGAAVVVGAGAWSIFRTSNETDAVAMAGRTAANAAGPSASASNWAAEAASAARRFPASPDLWQEAGCLLMTADPAAAARLFALAAQVRPDSASLRADLAAAAAQKPGQREAAWAFATRAFALPADPANWSVVHAALSSDVAESEAGEIKLAKLCAGSADRACGYVGWLMIESRWAAALAWIDRLAPAAAGDPRIGELRAELLCHTANLEALRSQLAAGPIGRAQSDAVDLALAAVAAGEAGKAELASRLCGAALGAAGDDPAAIKWVLRIAFDFGLKGENPEKFRVLRHKPALDAETARELEIWLASPAHSGAAVRLSAT